MGTPYEARNHPGLQRAPGKGRMWLLMWRQRRWRCADTSFVHAATHKAFCFCHLSTVCFLRPYDALVWPPAGLGQAPCSALPLLLLCTCCCFCTCLFLVAGAASLCFLC